MVRETKHAHTPICRCFVSNVPLLVWNVSSAALSERTAKWAREKKVRPAPEEPYFPGEGASGVWELACDRHDTPIKATKSGKK